MTGRSALFHRLFTSVSSIGVASLCSCLVGGGASVLGQENYYAPIAPVHNDLAPAIDALPGGGTQARLDQLEAALRNQQETILDQQAQIDAMQSGAFTAQEDQANGGNANYPKAKIGGQYRLMYNSSNFAFHQPQISDLQDSATYFNQRFRTWVTVETSENVRGYLQAEMGHILWGNEDLDFPKTYSVANPRDLTGVEMRYGYLEYETEGIGLLRAGIQAWNDPFGQVLASADWDFNIGGLLWEYHLSEQTKFTSGAFQLAENNVRFADDAYLLISDLDFINDEERTLGLSAYYLHDKGGYSYPTLAYDTAWDIWLGIRGSQQLGIGRLNAFAIYNGGARQDFVGPKYQHDGAALKLELAGVEVGPGKFSTQALYSTGGDSNQFRTIAQSARDNFGSQGYWSYLIITSPHGPSDVEDLGVSLQNRGLGLFTLQSKYEMPLTEKLSAVTSAGWLQSAVRNPTSQSSNMGTELVQALRYQFGPGLSSDFGAAAFFTGDFYQTAPGAARPDDLYEAFTRVQLDF